MLGESDLVYTNTLICYGEEDFKGKTVLILGGGDGGIIHELLKQKPKYITMAEVSGICEKCCNRKRYKKCRIKSVNPKPQTVKPVIYGHSFEGTPVIYGHSFEGTPVIYGHSFEGTPVIYGQFSKPIFNLINDITCIFRPFGRPPVLNGQFFKSNYQWPQVTVSTVMEKEDGLHLRTSICALPNLCVTSTVNHLYLKHVNEHDLFSLFCDRLMKRLSRRVEPT